MCCVIDQGHPQLKLTRLQQSLATCTPIETLRTRWTCHQVLVAIGPEHAARGGLLLEQLHIDVHARATEVTDTDDRDRLIRAIPDFRDIVAAYQRRDQLNRPGAVH